MKINKNRKYTIEIYEGISIISPEHSAGYLIAKYQPISL
jgi:hypothetical protein